MSIEEDLMNGKSTGVQSTLPYKYTLRYFFFPVLICCGSISKPEKCNVALTLLSTWDVSTSEESPSPPWKMNKHTAGRDRGT